VEWRPRVSEFLMCRAWQSFCEYIRHHVCRWDPGDFDDLQLDLLLYKMVLDIYVFRVGMKHRVFYDIDCAFIVTEYFCQFCLWMANQSKKVSEPYGLL